MSKDWPRLPSVLVLVILVADQISKQVVLANMTLGQTIPLWPSFYFSYVMNPGGAFSLLADAPAWVRQPLFLGVVVGAFWAGYSYWKNMPRPDKLSEWSLGLVGGGAIGNLIDRLRFGAVVDFIQVDIPTGSLIGWMGDWVPTLYTWPIFNVADSAICVGIALLFWRVFKPIQTEENAPDPA